MSSNLRLEELACFMMLRSWISAILVHNWVFRYDPLFLGENALQIWV